MCSIYFLGTCTFRTNNDSTFSDDGASPTGGGGEDEGLLEVHHRVSQEGYEIPDLAEPCIDPKNAPQSLSS